MEPLEPELRQALKDAHPGLSDEDIDRIEELNARRFELDPDTDTEELRRLEVEKDAFVARAMPRYREVVTAFTQQQAVPRRPPTDRVRIRIKRRDEGSG
jgi:hypothetical protein